MSTTMMDRRAFLAASSAGAIAVAVGGNLVIGGNGAWAMSTKALTGDEAAMLVRMARATYPHDKLDDAIYGKVVYALDEKASADRDAAEEPAGRRRDAEGEEVRHAGRSRPGPRC